MALSQTELAYIAGIIDGEGCLYIDRYIEKRTGKYAYCMRMKIGMTCLKTLTWIHEKVSQFYKCNLHLQKAKKFEKCKQAWVFAFSTKDLCRFCQDIFPYMITKKERCKLAIEYASTNFENNLKGRKGTFLPLPDDLRLKKDDLYHKLKFYNKNGET